MNGDFPTPAELREYDAVLPGTAERLLDMLQEEQNHSHRMAEEELTVMREQQGREDRRELFGQVSSFILFVLVSVMGFWLIMIDKDTSGLVLLLGELTTLGFVLSRKRLDINDLRQKPTG